MKTYHLNNQNGFTLVEMMVALLITGIMMILVMQFVFSQMQGYKREQMVSDTQQNLRTAIDIMERDIRMAGAGIPKVAISTGQTDLPNEVIYPLYIIQGATPQTTANQIFRMASAATNVNDSIIIIYKDPERPLADTVLAQDMPNPTSTIVLSKPNTTTQGFEINKNIPFIITNATGTKADLFMMDNINGNSGVVNLAAAPVYNDTAAGHQVNYLNASSAGAAYLGYKTGDKAFAVKVIRYDFSPDVDNFPITQLKNDDATRATNDAIGEFFGNTVTTAGISAANNVNQAMIIQYSPYLGASASASFTRGMPTSNLYDIGSIRITLTARTSVKTINFGNNPLTRTRALTSNIQLRNYNGN